MRRQRPKAKFPWPTFLGVVIAVAAAVGIVYQMKKAPKRGTLFKGENVEKGNVKEAPEEKPDEVKPAKDDTGLGARFEAAVKYAEERPDEFEVLIRRFRELEKAAKGTGYESKAAAKAKEFERAKRAAVARALKNLQAEAEKLAKDGRYPEGMRAIELLVGAPKQLRQFIGKEQIEQAKASLKNHAVLRLEVLATQADQLLNSGKFDEAVELLGTAKTWGLGDVSKMADERLEELRAKEAETREKYELKASKLYCEAFGQVLPLLKERKYDEATAKCDELLKDRDYRDIKDCIRKGKADIAMAKAVREAAIAALPGRIGKPFAIKGISGTLKQVKDGKLFLDSGGVELAQPITALTARNLASLAGPAMRELGGEGSLRLGLFWFFEGETRRAMKALEEAEAAGVDVSRCRKRLAYLEQLSEDDLGG